MVSNFRFTCHIAACSKKNMNYLINVAALCNKKMISPDPMMMMNPSSTRPSFNGAADGASYASSFTSGGSSRSTPTFVLGTASSTSFDVVSAE
jgi:hypothetical protein